METKYTIQAAVLILLFCIHTLGIFWFSLLILGTVGFLIGVLTILYLHHDDLDAFLNSSRRTTDPLAGADTETKALGLNLVRGGDTKPNIQVVAPNIKIQTDVRRAKDVGGGGGGAGGDGKKKSFLDSSFELLFKKHKGTKEGSGATRGEDETGVAAVAEDQRKWKPFESIKNYTDKKKDKERRKEEKYVQIGEEATAEKLGSTSASPKKKKIISGNKQIDSLLHTIIDFIIRDFIDSWFSSLSTNKEFSEISARNSIEETAINLCKRIKNAPLLPLLTTKLIDDVAQHCKLYRLATQAVTDKKSEQKKMKLREKLSPQRSLKGSHRRNKSDTELNWHLGGRPGSGQKNVANSKFYTAPEDPTLDPEMRLLNAFFDHCDLYKQECLDERALEQYLTHLTETILYFSLPEEDFDCLILRTFLGTLVANVVFKPLIYMLADPDFINLQISRQFEKDPPPGEFLIKMIRQCTDLSELRAVRQLITKEMDAKYREPGYSSELASLKYTQKLIDLRISNLQNNKSETYRANQEKFTSNLPILTLDEILTKELAISYYLDYLSILNLQKYVIFYLRAQDWKFTTAQSLTEISKLKANKDETLKVIRDKAFNLYQEYLVPTCAQYLNIDLGLIEVLKIKLKDTMLMPEPNWFDSICKFIYEKLKNEDVFLNNFYQSAAYKKLLLELEVNNETETESDLVMNVNLESGSDSNSGDLLLDEDDEQDIKRRLDEMPPASKKAATIGHSAAYDLHSLPGARKHSLTNRLLDVGHLKHARSASDCTEILQNINSLQVPELVTRGGGSSVDSTALSRSNDQLDGSGASKAAVKSPTTTRKTPTEALNLEARPKQRLTARIINTAIHCEGNFAVYAIQVSVIEDNQYKSWHIYRRYSKFLELKKFLSKRFPSLGKLPFPAKKAFQNTQRSVLEHRMNVLNEFLNVICLRAEKNEEMCAVIREFLEPDTNDKKIHGSAVVRTIETIVVNPFKTGIKTIKTIPDTLLGGISRILLGNKPIKHTSFLDYSSYQLEQSSDYPALKSALNLLDEVFDLQARSQWLRRGLINRVLGAPWVSHAINKRIINGAKSLMEIDKLDFLLVSILNAIWPDGKLQTHQPPRDDSTKLRTRMAARVSLFAFLSDDLKHVVGSETTRYGLLNFFQMLQNEKLNIRLVLVLVNDVLNTIFQVESMTRHVEQQ